MATQNTNASNNSLQSESTALNRGIGLFDGISILMGIMIGSGIFYLGSYVLMRSGMSMSLALLVWVIGGTVTLLSGLCYAELGAMMPKAGGSYIYLREAFGESTAFMSGLSGFIIGSCGSTAGLAIAFSSVISNFAEITEFQTKLIAIVLIVILTAINILGVKQGTLVQNIFTVGKLLPIGLILVCGLTMGNQMPDFSFQALPQVSITTFLGMIGFGVVATLWAYEGWTNLNLISEEIKNPKKNIPLAIVISIITVTILYTLFNFAIYRVLPMETVTTLINNGNYFLGTEVANVLFGNLGSILVGVCMAISIFGALNGCVMVFPRSCFAIARDGLLPKQLAKVHSKYKTPYVALLAHMVVSILLVCTRNLDQITSLVVFSGLIFNSLTFYSVIILRKKYPDLPRPYKAPTFVVYITILAMIALTLNTLKEDLVTSLIGLLIPALSFVIYHLIRKFKTTTEK